VAGLAEEWPAAAVHPYTPGVVRPAATARAGAARGTISGGLIRKPGLVLAGADGTARLALVQARGVGKIGRCEAQIPGKTAGLA